MESYTAEQERELIELAKVDAQAFGQLYEYYFGKLYGYVVYLVGNNTDAEDIVSETFEKAMRNIRNFEWRGYTFGAWLYKIARNLVYDKAKIKRTISLEDIENILESPNLSVEDQVEIKLETENLLRLIAQLSDDQREILALRYIQGYSIKETCAITGKTVDSVKSLVKRALAILREQTLDEQQPGTTTK